MARTNHQIVRDFLAALSQGGLTDDMLSPEMTAWTVISGPIDRESYRAAFELFPRIFKDGPHITMHSLTAEEDRVVAEFTSQGTLLSGDAYRNDYLFLFRVRDGQITYVGEYFDPKIVLEKIGPAMQAAMGGAEK